MRVGNNVCVCVGGWVGGCKSVRVRACWRACVLCVYAYAVVHAFMDIKVCVCVRVCVRGRAWSVWPT